MKVSIMQPYVFPYIGYFQLIRDADLFVIFDDVNFRKRSWINRNQILLNHQAHLFTLNLSEASSCKKINEIRIGDNRNILLKTFRQAYSRAPYFEQTMPLLEALVLYEEPQLALYLAHQLEMLSRHLGIHTRFVLSSSIEKDNALKGQDKILAICDALGADSYTNAIGGRHLYFEENFASRGIALKFIKSNNVHYRQFGNEFIPWLSIIDVLMFNSVSQVRRLLDEYELVSSSCTAEAGIAAS
jgi:hypothetical protein